ncbi:pyridoxamine 5'-phosphate oxidase [Arsenicibacter rosenii]|uniref:Pyridoxine/pyridoxamine 5'-phosphate oxidase n=1 Tax=Arsenicibacter rosenii TaxID=1750698 RepID=A0A1S2VQ82_9BACT|nr:pyridoxamine 5'-phosphate oxidase [Arsenicibacter rosenii]OIN60904.1 pyridoxamine 5'-phosphate oxidase [Arsenicibacter rosenii]
MSNVIADMRRDYTLAGLDIADVLPDPVQQFRRWFDEALKAGLPEPNAMHLATVGAGGKPAGRIVLLKEVDDTGFVFYTNYESRKGHELAAHPVAALTFFFVELERQIRIEGTVEKVTAEESDAYFAIRPRGSQIGAWVSHQSDAIAGREVLAQRQQELEARFEGKDIPRPPHWGGYRVIPSVIEFWQGRPSRLHDRIQYAKDAAGAWQLARLSP